MSLIYKETTNSDYISYNDFINDTVDSIKNENNEEIKPIIIDNTEACLNYPNRKYLVVRIFNYGSTRNTYVFLNLNDKYGCEQYIKFSHRIDKQYSFDNIFNAYNFCKNMNRK